MQADRSGSQHVEVGFRDNLGIIQEVQRFETMTIPRLSVCDDMSHNLSSSNKIGNLRVRSSNEANPLWTSQQCLETFDVLADFIVQTILPSDPIPSWKAADVESRSQLPEPVIWRIGFEPRKGITLNVAEDSWRDDEDRWGFLPLSYVQESVDAP